MKRRESLTFLKMKQKIKSIYFLRDQKFQFNSFIDNIKNISDDGKRFHLFTNFLKNVKKNQTK